MIKIVIFDDHRERSEAIRLLISLQDDMMCIGLYEDCTDLVKNLTINVPDVVLMDVHMPRVSGLEGVKLVKKYFPEILIIMQTVFEDDDNLFDSLLAGAHSYFLKKTSNKKMMEEIINVIDGESAMTPEIAKRALSYFRENEITAEEKVFPLSDRETSILVHIANGYSLNQIAKDFFFSKTEINNLIRNIYNKMHSNNANLP